MGRDEASLSCPGSSVVADCDDGSGRFESSTDPKVIDSDRVQSFPTQSLTEGQETGEDPIKPHRTG